MNSFYTICYHCFRVEEQRHRRALTKILREKFGWPKRTKTKFHSSESVFHQPRPFKAFLPRAKTILTKATHLNVDARVPSMSRSETTPHMSHLEEDAMTFARKGHHKVPVPPLPQLGGLETPRVLSNEAENSMGGECRQISMPSLRRFGMLRTTNHSELDKEKQIPLKHQTQRQDPKLPRINSSRICPQLPSR